MDRNNLVILNDGTATRITPPGTNSSASDLVITTMNVALHFNWKVVGNPGISDDLPCLSSF